MLFSRGIGVFGILAAAALLTMSAAAQAPQPLTGTWKLNLAKSTFDPADLSAPSLVVTYEVKGDTVTASLDGVDSGRHAVHSEYTAAFDGKEHPIKGTIDGKPAADQGVVSWKRIDGRTYEVLNRNGQVITMRRIVVAPDGKSRTTTITGRDAQGRSIHHVMFFDRQ